MTRKLSFDTAKSAKSAKTGSERRTYLFMGGAVTILALALWLPIGAGGDDVVPVQAASIVPTSADLTSTEIARTISERPLFHVSRRPPQEAKPAPPPEVTISLVGVINDNQTEIALLRMSSAPGVHRMAVGEQLGRWRVTGITELAVTVTDDEGKVSVMALNGDG